MRCLNSDLMWTECAVLFVDTNCSKMDLAILKGVGDLNKQQLANCTGFVIVLIRWFRMRAGFMIRAGMLLILMSMLNSEMAHWDQHDEQINQYKTCTDNVHGTVISMFHAGYETMKTQVPQGQGG